MQIESENPSTLISHVFQVMRDCQWRTHHEIAKLIGGESEFATGTALESLKGRAFGAHIVHDRYRGHPYANVIEFQLEVCNPQEPYLPLFESETHDHPTSQ